MLSGKITLNKWLKNKIVLKLAPSAQKDIHLPFMEIIVALTKKAKVVHIKQVWSGWNRIKAATGYSENSFFEKFPQQQQLVSCSYQRTQSLVKFLNNSCLRSDFTTQPLSKLNNFYSCKKRCTTTINPYPHPMILQSLQCIFILRPEDDLISNCGPNLRKGCFFWWRCTLHWRGEHGDLCTFWLWLYLLPWNSYKNQTDQPRTELHFQILWKTPMHSQQRSTYLFCWWAT